MATPERPRCGTGATAACPAGHRTTAGSCRAGCSARRTSRSRGEDRAGTVVLLPGRHANAAVATPLVTALAERHRVVVVDPPGEVGLSAGGRPNTARLREYGSWLRGLLPQLADRPVHLVGHGSGAAVALAAPPSSHVARLLLVNPAGLVPSAPHPGLWAAGVRWRLRPTPRSSRRVLAQLWGPGTVPDELVEWLEIVGRHVAWSSTPPPPPRELVRRWSSVPCIVAAGEHDVVFPPDRLTAAARDLLGARTVTVPAAGHLLPYERPGAVLDLLAEHRAPASSWPAPPRAVHQDHAVR